MNEQLEYTNSLPPQIIAAISDIDLLKEEREIRNARKDFWAYRQYINKNLKDGWWQRQVAKELQQFVEDLIAGLKPILVLSSPPQHGKSVQIIDLMTWIFGKYPHLKTIFASFSDRLGVRANLRIKRIMEGEKYKKVFPDMHLPTLTDKGYTNNREFIEFIDEEGSFRNTTVGGSVTGESLDVGIIDDAIKGREAASSETIRDKTWEWLTDDFLTRFSECAGLLFIGTRWHIDDPMGRLIDSKPDNLKILKYEAIATKDEEFRKEGEALFPELKSLEFLLARKKIMGTANFEALYQQSPIIVGGGIFNVKWWKYYHLLPKIKYSIIVADTAMKTKEQNDYSVFMLWCMSEDGNAYLEDVIRGKWEAPQLLTTFVAFYNKHKANPNLKLRNAAIEDKSSGTGLIQTVKQRFKIPVKEIKRDTQDKVSRAQAITPLIESGYVYLKNDAPWLSDLLEELTIFNNGKHDDQVDCVSDGLDQLFNTIKEFNVRVI